MCVCVYECMCFSVRKRPSEKNVLDVVKLFHNGEHGTRAMDLFPRGVAMNVVNMLHI